MNELSSFLRELKKKKVLRLFMPGHQGCCEFLNRNISAEYDVTEIEGADNLYKSCGVIKSLEEKISKLYGCSTYISAGGSTLCVQTILWLLKDKKFVVQRGVHLSFHNTAALLSISPVFIGNYRTVSVKEIKKAFLEVGRGCVLFLTSPNYYGEILDIAKISKICDEFGAILVVDCAHGAHLRFTKKNLHPIFLGADICCCSFHKTLPALTGASIVCFKDGLFEKDIVKKAMLLFGSSSPSYLIMDSIGLCADWLEKSGFKAYEELEKRKDLLLEKLRLPFLKTDPSKLVLDCSKIEGGVFKVVRSLEEDKIVPEFFNDRFVCFILGPFLKEEGWQKLESCFFRLRVKFSEEEKKESLNFKKRCSIKRALYSKKERVSLKEAENRVCADFIFSDVPGVLLINIGEIITKNVIEHLEKNGILNILVMEEE